MGERSAPLTPSGPPASSSSARRASALRRRFRGDFPIGGFCPSLPPPHLFITLFEPRLRPIQCIGHPLIGRRDRPPRTRLWDLLQEPPPLRFPDDHFPVDATNDRLLDHGVIVVAPIAGGPSLRCGLGSLICGGGGSCSKLRTDSERNQGWPSGWFGGAAISNAQYLGVPSP
jgi:hypothetical protein